MLMYADDTMLLANSVIDLEKLLKFLECYCDSNGLEFNTTKTKIMIFRRAGKLKTNEIERFFYKSKKKIP